MLPLKKWTARIQWDTNKYFFLFWGSVEIHLNYICWLQTNFFLSFALPPDSRLHHIWNKEMRSKTSGKIYMKTTYEIFLQWNTKFFSSESSVSPTFWILPKLYELCKSCRRNPIYIYIYMHIIILILTNTYNINWWFLFNPKILFFCLLLTVHQDSKIHGCWVWKQVNTKIKFNSDKNLGAKK